MSESASVHALVVGRVQGVGFRWCTRQRARELGLSGWVANLDDGRVEVWAEGSPAAFDGLIAWLERGPSGARVDSLVVERGAASAFIAHVDRRLAF